MHAAIREFDHEREEIFNELSSRWEKITEGDHSLPLRELMEVSDVAEKIVLDIGAGTGILVEQGLKAKASKWIALDLSSKMLEILRSKYPLAIKESWLDTLHADIHHLPLEKESVDRVICHNAYPHFHNPDAALGEIFRVLKPRGMLVINHYSGRAFINHIHSQSPHPILKKDLLEAADILCSRLIKVGFSIRQAVDLKDKYRVVAYKER